MKIRVTKKDIERGIPFDSAGCAVSLAVTRAMGELWYVGCNFAMQPGQEAVRMPRIARERIVKMCNFQKVRPFTFDFPAPKPRKAPRAHGL